MRTEVVESPSRRTEAARGAHRGGGAPRLPESIQETGLTEAFVSDLLLKTLLTHGAQSGEQLARRLRLLFTVLDECIPLLQKRRMIEVRGTDGHGRRSYVFDLTTEGRARAREVLDGNAYVGPAPITSRQYRDRVRSQSIQHHPIPRERIQEGLGHLVLDQGFLDRLGPGINSGRSIFLYGHPGNGKTEIAFSIARIMGGEIYVPYAVEMEGQVVQVYDPHIHESPEEGPETGAARAGDGRVGSGSAAVGRSLLREVPEHDPRFVRVGRPAVIVGGELTLDELELQEVRRGVFVAPPQVKAAGGVFVIDDFGRQRVRPRDLLNRWMIPLDRRTDYLGLPTGHKLEVPFDCLVFFATNLNPADLVEEAFLRRIRYKIFMPNPSREEWAEILRRVCARRSIEFDPGAVELVFDQFYGKLGIEPRACHPGDLVADILDSARYQGVEPSLSDDLLLEACLTYFIDMPKLDQVEYDDITEGRDRG